MIKDIAIFFTTIMLEVIPFLLLGSVISALMEIFVKREHIDKYIPKNKILGSIVGVFLGFFLPACDCAVIPIAIKMKQKKIPTNTIVSFMLASPIINPVVLFSTFFAFSKTEMITTLGLNLPKLFVYRFVFGIVIAFVIGIIMEIFFKEEVLKEEQEEICTCSCCSHNHHEEHEHSEKTSENILIRLLNTIRLEFLEVLKPMLFRSNYCKYNASNNTNR